VRVGERHTGDVALTAHSTFIKNSQQRRAVPNALSIYTDA
jgi:hypothetical protein